MKNSCESYISIHGSSNINQFRLINHNPEIVRLSDGVNNKKRDQRIEISVNQFKGANKQMREDFLEMVNADKYPFIIMTIESRNLAECMKNKGLSDFNTKITIAGVSQSFVVPCEVDTCKSSGYVLKGSLEVKLTDFGIDPPKKFFGLVKVNNEVLIDYVFKFYPDDDIFRLSMREKPPLTSSSRRNRKFLNRANINRKLTTIYLNPVLPPARLKLKMCGSISSNSFG